jgi:hypothetical protein
LYHLEKEDWHEQDQKSSLAQTSLESQEIQRETKGSQGECCHYYHIHSAALMPRFHVVWKL